MKNLVGVFVVLLVVAMMVSDIEGKYCLADIRSWPNVGLLLDQRRRFFLC